MRSLVVFESMYGNTREVAEAVAEALASFGEARAVPVAEATPDTLEELDLLVVGGPTHVHGMSRPSTRESAVDAAAEPGSDLEMDPDAAGDGVREWLESLPSSPAPTARAAAFDTRVDVSALLSGRASKGIAKRLRAHGFRLIAEPESFLVSKETHLLPDEVDHARAWGTRLGEAAAG